jgi:phosphoribosylamine--glycine ligase
VRVLVIGSGAREHALCVALSSDPAVSALACGPGNAGTRAVAEPLVVAAADPAAVAAAATAWRADLVVIGPEVPLVAGAADAVRDAGIPCFGPSAEAAQLEGSKSFAKHVMTAAGVPTARAWPVGGLAELETVLDEVGAPYVVKDDGLAAGKGVLVTDDRGAALAHADAYLGAGAILVEEFLSGPEVSLFFLSDGDHVLPLTPAQDFKRLGDGDSGPNTGGMGAYSPLPWLAEPFGGEDAFVALVTRDIAQPVIRQLDAEGTPFIGLLYAGLILTPRGVKVIEFNARFGDPETQVVLPRLLDPLSQLLLAAASGTLEDQARPAFADAVAVTVVLASEGYPAAPVTGRALSGLDAASAVPGVHVAHAATATEGDGLVATGGRVLNVVGVGTTFAEARERTYRALAEISLEGGQYRTDIAARVVEHGP